MQNSVELIFLLICLLASLTSFIQRPSPFFLRLFPFYFLLTFLVQQVGNFLSQRGVHNTPLYNAYSIIEFIFYFFIFREIIRNTRVKAVILGILIVYPLVASFNIFYFQRVSSFHSMTFSIGCAVIVILCIVYFVELFQLPEATNLKNEPSFWICTAILFSYVCTFPFWGLVNFMKTAPALIIKHLMTILMFINVLSYSLFTIAFLCRLRIRKSIS
jgi:hypothetical protein